MEWYGVKLLLKAVDGKGETRLAEESIRILRAKSLENAEQLARSRYKPVDLKDGFNVNGDPCTWHLDQVLDVYSIAEELDEDVEIYSVILQPDEAKVLSELYVE